MHESNDDLEALQRVLDESYAGAGKHLLSIHTPNWRMSAEDVVSKLTGMCVLNLATVNSRGEPIQGPVDGMFYRGRFFCGSARNSLRAQHIKANPAVSVAHVRGEELAVIVHGTALEVDPESETGLGFRKYIVEVYGGEMTEWEGSSVVYWEVAPRKMFALAPVVEGGESDASSGTEGDSG
ncbi:MAG TPA: pyridoxamine 5'-phosphate oxidase family protein [Actinomycetota bacterium]|nr:pyridoxamine 5'-phosphate oxidase family protein [Actinomycetota bacterium]